MNVFIQGMRRNGTTIFFDLFCEDGGFGCYYEPLAAALKPAIGGGSEARSVDYFENVRDARRRFMEQYSEISDPSVFNHGAPRCAALELDRESPEYLTRYIRFCHQSPDTVIKFTRAYHRVGMLSGVDPDAVMLHVVRDPRRVVASYMFGKSQRNRRHYPDQRTFFTSNTNRTAWSSYQLSELLLSRSEYSQFRGLPDFMRLLLLWKDCFASTYRAGRDCFGDRYMLLRHEDLLLDADRTLDRIYSFIKREVPDRVRSWAGANIRQAGEVFAPRSSNWLRAFEQLDMMPGLAAAGYLPE